ncbi:MAG: hypothetical protein H3C43_06475 [Leptonema sp. (in: Bacteria)]|nr:hypothetical protein [Leptonema sp. (in: bacteria)]
MKPVFMHHLPFTHITITFIILMLPSMIALVYFLHREKLTISAWTLAPIFSFLTTALIYATMYTGSLDFDYGQEYLPKDAVSAHSDLAEILLIISIISVVLAVLGRKRKTIRLLYLICLSVMVGITLKVILLGTVIVYR